MTAAAVIVAVDHGSRSFDAVDWAAAEAAARRCPLVVLLAFRRTVPLARRGPIPVLARPGSVPRAAARALRTSVDRARSVAPELPVVADLVVGRAGRVLVEQSRSAGLLVLGGVPPGAVRAGITGSVVARLAVGARCPVVVVPSRPPARSAAAAPCVVVGVGARPSCIPAIEFAFRAAAQRGIPLRAVHAWRRNAAVDPDGDSGHLGTSEATARDDLARVLGCWRDRFPGVRVDPQVLPGDPAAVLAAESAATALVVVGSSRGRAVRARVFRCVASGLVRRAQGPVAVVGPERAGADAPELRRHRPPMTGAV